MDGAIRESHLLKSRLEDPSIFHRVRGNVQTIGVEWNRNPVLLVREAVRQTDVEGSIYLLDISCLCLRRQLVSAPEGLVDVKNDIIGLLRLRPRLLGRAALCLASASRGGSCTLLPFPFCFLGSKLRILGQSRRGQICPASDQFVHVGRELIIVEDHANFVRLLTTHFLTACAPR